MQITRRGLLAGGAALALGGQALGGSALAQGPALVTKPVPSSGERIPIIGLGTARRYEEARTDADMAPLRETFARFSALGGTVIDTAPSYGNAEAIMGRLVSDLGLRPRLFLATKVGADSKEAGRAQIEQAFRNLQTDLIDLIAVHNLRDTANQLATLRDLKAAGRIRYVGATTSFDRQYQDFEAMMRAETLDSIQIDYALDDRGSADRIIPLARDRGMAVFVNLPFGRGRLFKATEGRPLPDWAAEIDCTSWAQVFLKYIVSHDAVTCAVPGMAQARYVDDNLKAAQGRMPDAALRRRMEQFIDAL
jgi:aryl-alcohol dehydrogenase-like predicted oxidoreductase